MPRIAVTKHTTRNPRARRRRPATAVAMTALPEPAELPELTESAESVATAAPGEPAGAATLREMTQGIDVPLAVELETALERALAAFETEHAELVRKACDVPDSHMDLRDVVWCTFLGHVLQRLEGKRGRAHVERLTTVLLDQFVMARQQVAKLMGTIQ